MKMKMKMKMKTKMKMKMKEGTLVRVDYSVGSILEYHSRTINNKVDKIISIY